MPRHVSVVGVEEENQTSEAFLNDASYLLQGKKKKQFKTNYKVKKQLKTNLDDINHTAEVPGYKYILVESAARVKIIAICMPNNINYI